MDDQPGQHPLHAGVHSRVLSQRAAEHIQQLCRPGLDRGHIPDGEPEGGDGGTEFTPGGDVQCLLPPQAPVVQQDPEQLRHHQGGEGTGEMLRQTGNIVATAGEFGDGDADGGISVEIGAFQPIGTFVDLRGQQGIPGALRGEPSVFAGDGENEGTGGIVDPQRVGGPFIEHLAAEIDWEGGQLTHWIISRNRSA